MTLNKNRRGFALAGSLLLALVLLVAFGASCASFQRAPPTPEPVEALGIQKFYRDAYFKGSIETAGNLVVGGLLTTTGAQLNLGNQITDNVRVWGQLRTWDGNDNYADVPVVDDLSQTNGWQASYNVMGWGPAATTFQALFANARLTATMQTTQSIVGITGRATLTGTEGAENATATGLLGQVTAEATATIPIAYGVRSLVETAAAGDMITSSVNFHADLANTGLITTSRVIYTAADTWTYGLDLSNATILSGDIVLQNGETIDNSRDGVITLTATTIRTVGDLDVIGDLHLPNNVTLTGRIDVVGGLVVTGTTQLRNELDVWGAISDLNSDLHINDNVTVTGNVDVVGGLVVTGTTQLRDELDVWGAISDLNGSLHLNDSVTITGNVDVVGGLVVTGTTQLRNELDIWGNISNSDTAVPDVTFTDNVSITNDLQVVENVRISGTLTIEDVAFSGPITFGSDTVTTDGEQIAHGLGAIPASVILTPISATLVTSVTVAISAADATNFTVEIIPAHVSGMIGVYWMAGR